MILLYKYNAFLGVKKAFGVKEHKQCKYGDDLMFCKRASSALRKMPF